MQNITRTEAATKETFVEILSTAENLQQNHAEKIIAEIYPQADSYILSIIAKHPATKPQMLIEIVDNPNLTIEGKIALAENDKTPSTVLSKLYASSKKDDRLFLALASNPNTSQQILSKLAKNRKWEIRQQVAFHKKVSPAVITELAHDKDSTVRLTALRNGKLPTEEIIQILGTNPDLPQVRAAAHNPNLPVELAIAWVDHHEVTVKSAIAVNPVLPVNELAKLVLENEDSRILSSIAQIQNLHEEISLLLCSPAVSLDIRMTLASNPTISTRTAVNLLVDPAPSVRRRAATGQKHLTSASLTQAVLEEEDPRVIAAICAHPATPDNVVLSLLYQNLVSSPANTVAITRSITHSVKAINQEIANLIARADDTKALATLASRADCPLAIFTACAKHEKPILRLAAASNPDCPPHLLNRLTVDQDPTISFIALTHPSYELLPKTK